MDTMTRRRTLSMSTLMDEPVRNMQGQDVGEIEDYMIDLERGCVEYAVLSFGGFLGIGEKLFAIPWDSMRLDTESRAWVLDVSKERLQDAPGFNRDNWPDLGDMDYRRSLSTFWAVNTGGRVGEDYPGVREGYTETEERYAGQAYTGPERRHEAYTGPERRVGQGYAGTDEGTVERDYYGTDERRAGREFGETDERRARSYSERDTDDPRFR